MCTSKRRTFVEDLLIQQNVSGKICKTNDKTAFARVIDSAVVKSQDQLVINYENS